MELRFEAVPIITEYQCQECEEKGFVRLANQPVQVVNPKPNTYYHQCRNCGTGHYLPKRYPIIEYKTLKQLK